MQKKKIQMDQTERVNIKKKENNDSQSSLNNNNTNYYVFEFSADQIFN